MALEVGKHYLVGGQGTNIAPVEIEVSIIWLDEDRDAIHYKKQDGRVYQTTITRFEQLKPRERDDD